MTSPNDQRAYWYAVWVDVEPETGVDALKVYLDGQGRDEGSHAAQLFITTLMGSSRGGRASGANFGSFSHSAVPEVPLYSHASSHSRNGGHRPVGRWGVFARLARRGAKGAGKTVQSARGDARQRSLRRTFGADSGASRSECPSLDGNACPASRRAGR